MPVTAVVAGFALRDENTALPELTLTPLAEAREVDAESTRVTEAVAPLHPAGSPPTVTAVIVPDVAVHVAAAEVSDPHVPPADVPAPSFAEVGVMPAAWATPGTSASAQSTTRTGRTLRGLILASCATPRRRSVQSPHCTCRQRPARAVARAGARQPVTTTAMPSTLAARMWLDVKSGEPAPDPFNVPVTSASEVLELPYSVTLNALLAQPAAVVTGAVVTS